ncbi:hypothetical protein KBY85_03005 [Cyanobium sp. BA5m-10]|uniref:hypothetical protein n=1 Tax=Cyanobium sp. BA5m-10 TaxID=2823705 RepID=UPI0020CD4A9A|nr:hypothetical protein [Cyanobium sp. BA5m-10]MCP9903110.1 hypothetical protein [Cyanobium sp. BA5m-10]
MKSPLMETPCRYYTVRPVSALHPYLEGPDCVEHTSDLDRARDVALTLCDELQVDVGVYQHFGVATCLWELYDVASYG